MAESRTLLSDLGCIGHNTGAILPQSRNTIGCPTVFPALANAS
jgi:hypothetical protein